MGNEEQAVPMPTLGEQRVRVTFNPANSDRVHVLKTKFAELIDMCESMKDAYDGKPNEKNRVLAVAQTELETACMYAVKGATA